jgi:hypothetical protein
VCVEASDVRTLEPRTCAWVEPTNTCMCVEPSNERPEGVHESPIKVAQKEGGEPHAHGCRGCGRASSVHVYLKAHTWVCRGRKLSAMPMQSCVPITYLQPEVPCK